MALMQFTLERLQESSFRICLVMQSNKNELRMEDFPGGTPTTGGGVDLLFGQNFLNLHRMKQMCRGHPNFIYVDPPLKTIQRKLALMCLLEESY